MTRTATDQTDSPADSRPVQWLRLLKLVLTVLTLVCSLWKLLTGLA
ncbi:MULTISPECIES: hypothetical protein [Halorussus]|nr:hypothetical protein [Halorussus vallis]USZ77333.1 hypothetical protein NGM07_08370 [Halorussus vallis]